MQIMHISLDAQWRESQGPFLYSSVIYSAARQDLYIGFEALHWQDLYTWEINEPSHV